ncbi:MAG: hypothetical protein R2776_07815 [Flavobacteriaceae bacterium]
MNSITIVIIVIIVLHLVIGFGWLIYKLSPRKKGADTETKDKEESQKNNR